MMIQIVPGPHALLNVPFAVALAIPLFMQYAQDFFSAF